MKCVSVFMCQGVKNCCRALQQIVYEAAGISYRFSVAICLAVQLSLSSPQIVYYAAGTSYLQLVRSTFFVRH